MALAVAQKGDSGGTGIASGSAGTVLPANATVSNHVVLAVGVTNHTQTISGITGICTTWTKASAVSLSVADVEVWSGTVTSAARTATVTTGGATWFGQCTEVSGGVSSIATGGTATNTTANPSLTVSSLAAGDLVLAIAAVAGSFTGGPSSPWVDYAAGGFTIAAGQDVAYNILSSGSTTTVTWTATAQSWAIAAIVIVPTTTTAISAAITATSAVSATLTSSIHHISAAIFAGSNVSANLTSSATPLPVSPPAPIPISVVKGVDIWKFVLATPDGTQLGELSDAKAKTVTWPLNDVATASFTMDGTLDQAAFIAETETDLIVYDRAGKKRFRGRMGTSSDQIDTTGHLSTFNAVDYRGLLARRVLRGAAQLVFAGEDQAQIAWRLISDSESQPLESPRISRGTGSVTNVPQTVTFTQFAKVSDSIDQVANVINGFEYEIDGDLAFNVFYPQRGLLTSVVLEFDEESGGSVANVARTLDTSTFANYVVYSGADTIAPVEVGPTNIGTAGIFETALGNSAILDEGLLQSTAGYELAKDSVLTPSYTLILKPGWWTPELLWIGDTAEVVVKSGRIFDDINERITQVQLVISDDNPEAETVTMTTGPVPQSQVKKMQLALNRIRKLELGG